MMIISKNETEACDSELHQKQDGNECRPACFRRALTFLRIRKEKKTAEQLGGTLDCCSDTENELEDHTLCFLQWYDVMEDKMVAFDNICKALNCLRLR